MVVPFRCVFCLAKIFYIADMGILFENPNAKSLYKKWYATNVLPIPTPLQVLSSKNPYKKSPIRIYRHMFTCIRLKGFLI